MSYTPKVLDLTGQRFGRLTVIQKSLNKKQKTYWLCKCECGKEKEVQTSHLVNGLIKSCGCLHQDNKQSSKKVIDYRRRIKAALVEANMHKCACCGLEDEPIVYDFHHLNPESKLFGIGNGSITRNKQAYADEAKKCVMLCSNCHRKIENGLISQEGLKIIFDENKYYSVLENLINHNVYF